MPRSKAARVLNGTLLALTLLALVAWLRGQSRVAAASAGAVAVLTGAEMLWAAATVPRGTAAGASDRALLVGIAAAGAALVLGGVWLLARAT